ncbi:MAG: ABC transporter permease [Candidatus Eiseniibacteriota bacterium]
MSERADTFSRTAELRESVRLALDVLRAHKMRSSLVVLGVAIGVTVLMGMVAVLRGLAAKIEAEITASDKPTVTLSRFDFITEGDPTDDKVLARPDIMPEDAGALERLCRSVGLAEFYYDTTSFVIMHHGDERTRPIGINGSGPNAVYVFNVKLARGRFFTDVEVANRAQVIVIGHAPAEDLFPSVDPIGRRVRVGDDHFEVIGVAAARKSIFGGLGDSFALVPWTTFEKRIAREYDPRYVYMTVADGYTPSDVEQEARAVMRMRHGLRPADKDDFVLTSADRVNEFVKRITGPIGMVLVAMSSIGLTVGGIGVMNIMLVSVTERTREIGIRMALGARRRTILTQFLIEAGTLTGIGGAVGVAAGFGLADMIGRLLDFPAAVHPLAALLGVVFSTGIGVFFGLYPAHRASRLDPIDALRYE